jgi:hypothetical protein
VGKFDPRNKNEIQTEENWGKCMTKETNESNVIKELVMWRVKDLRGRATPTHGLNMREYCGRGYFD